MFDNTKKEMKKAILGLAIMCTALGASAQTSITGSLSPHSGSVYSPNQYSVMYVSYDCDVDAENAVAELTVGSEKIGIDVLGNESNVYGFELNLNAALEKLNVTENTKFTVMVDGVKPANPTEESDSVLPVEGTFVYMSSIPTVVGWTPAPGKLDSQNSTVKVTFSAPVNVGNIIVMSGPFFERVSHFIEGPEGYSNTVTIDLKEEYWYTSENMTYPVELTIVLSDVTVEGGYSVPGTEATYSYGEAGAATLIEVIPTAEEVTAQEQYGYQVDFIFSAKVDMTNVEATAVVTYYDFMGEIGRINVPMKNIFDGEDWWTGGWFLSVPIPTIDGVDVSEIEQIDVKLQGIQSNGTPLKDEVISYYSTIDNKIIKKSNAQANISKVITSDSKVTVYNLQGSVVLSNTNASELKNLPKGVYVVNDIKVVIR